MIEGATLLKKRLAPYMTIDTFRGILAIAIGLITIIRPDLVLTLLAYGAGIYFIADGIADLVMKRRYALSRSSFWLAAIDIVLGVALLANITIQRISVTPFLIALVVIARGLIHGSQTVVNSRKYPRGLPLRRGLDREGTIKIVGALFFVVLAPFSLQLIVYFLGVYLLFDGMAYLTSAIARSPTGRDHVRYATDGRAITPDVGPRAIVFLRRSGAFGLGHVAWAFEWPTGWFNAGSVENPAGKPIARPDEMGFWCAHTLDPIATSNLQMLPYNEFKVFHVSSPSPKAAWSTVAWVAHQHYAIVRGNCADRTYDVLRTYGVETLIDPAKLNAPTTWYDALPGPSYRISEFPSLPLAPPLQRRAERYPVRMKLLTIRPSIVGTVPPWRVDPTRAWYEYAMLEEKIRDNARRFARILSILWRWRAKHPNEALPIAPLVVEAPLLTEVPTTNAAPKTAEDRAVAEVIAQTHDAESL